MISLLENSYYHYQSGALQLFEEPRGFDGVTYPAFLSGLIAALGTEDGLLGGCIRNLAKDDEAGALQEDKTKRLPGTRS